MMEAEELEGIPEEEEELLLPEDAPSGCEFIQREEPNYTQAESGEKCKDTENQKTSRPFDGKVGDVGEQRKPLEQKEFDWIPKYSELMDDGISIRKHLFSISETKMQLTSDYFESLIEQQESEENYKMLKNGVSSLLREYKVCYMAEKAFKDKSEKLEAALKSKDQAEERSLEVLRQELDRFEDSQEESLTANELINELIRKHRELKSQVRLLREERLELIEGLRKIHDILLTSKPLMKQCMEMVFENTSGKVEETKQKYESLMKVEEKVDAKTNLSSGEKSKLFGGHRCTETV